MAILDNELLFASATSVAAAAGTAVIGNVVDTTAGLTVQGNINQGPQLDGRQLYFVLQVTTGIITGGSAGTVEFDLVSSAAAALSSPVVHIRGVSLTTGTSGIEAGTILVCAPLPKGLANPTVTANKNLYKRYLGVQCITGTTTTTAGAISAYLTYDPPAWQATYAGI